MLYWVNPFHFSRWIVFFLFVPVQHFENVSSALHFQLVKWKFRHSLEDTPVKTLNVKKSKDFYVFPAIFFFYTRILFYVYDVTLESLDYSYTSGSAFTQKKKCNFSSFFVVIFVLFFHRVMKCNAFWSAFHVIHFELYRAFVSHVYCVLCALNLWLGRSKLHSHRHINHKYWKHIIQK